MFPSFSFVDWPFPDTPTKMARSQNLRSWSKAHKEFDNSKAPPPLTPIRHLLYSLNRCANTNQSCNLGRLRYTNKRLSPIPEEGSAPVPLGSNQTNLVDSCAKRLSRVDLGGTQLNQVTQEQSSGKASTIQSNQVPEEHFSGSTQNQRNLNYRHNAVLNEIRQTVPDFAPLALHNDELPNLINKRKRSYNATNLTKLHLPLRSEVEFAQPFSQRGFSLQLLETSSDLPAVAHSSNETCESDDLIRCDDAFHVLEESENHTSEDKTCTTSAPIKRSCLNSIDYKDVLVGEISFSRESRQTVGFNTISAIIDLTLDEPELTTQEQISNNPTNAETSVLEKLTEIGSIGPGRTAACNSVNCCRALHANIMYPIAVDQSRQEAIPTQHMLQLHMHHVCCPCTNVVYPYYPPGYRPPLLPQPPPIPRPSYLHHYQYTQLHVNPSYPPLPAPMTQHFPQTTTHSPPATVDLAFGPPPRDRRNLENQEYDDQRQIPDKTKTDNHNALLQYTPVHVESYGAVAVNATENLQETFRSLTATQVAALSTENYIKYLDNGCFIGETIARRNEQRPCFKNIQNLCNRTRSEVMKPNITVSNIHSQGVPWATKDFIFAFVRAINCWCILRGYLGCKDGSLGKIDREISPEFRACYAKWEKCTKQLTHYLIQTFYKLDEANSSPNLNASSSQSHANQLPSTSASTTTLASRGRNSSPPQETPRKAAQVLNETAPQNIERKLSNKEMVALKGIPGILHIRPSPSADLGDVCNPNSESPEISPRDEDSDSERRVYMKPGSYNVPTKQQSSQSATNSPRSIEFLDTAQNVAAHHRKVASEKPDTYASDVLRDKVWQTAQNVTPEFIKQTEETSSNAGADNLYDRSTHHNKQIESWLNNELNRFFSCDLNDEEEDNAQQPEDVMQSTVSGISAKANDILAVRCDSLTNVDIEAASRSYRNKPVSKSYSAFRKNFSNKWEYKNGGLTEIAVAAAERILKELEYTDIALQITLKNPYTNLDEGELINPTYLSTISKKLKSKTYSSVNELIHDFRHVISCASEYFKDAKHLKQLTIFRDKCEEMIGQVFSGVDFNHIVGDPNEALGSLVFKPRGRSRKDSEGDGDH